MELSNEMGVTLIDSMGDEQSIVKAARVSTQTECQPGADEGLIRFLMRNKHASPFEHITMTFLIDVPMFVRSEWMRHRTFSYNEVSGRYSELKPKFYMPSDARPICQMGKPGAYRFKNGVREQQVAVTESLYEGYEVAWGLYRYQLEQGIAKEVARMVLPVALYTQFYVTGNLRNWLNFLSLRTAEDALYEIRAAAGHVEAELRKVTPAVLFMWDEYGRGQL